MIVHRITDSYTGLILLNIAARGAVNICSDRGIEIPTTVKELDERLINPPKKQDNPVPFYLQDPVARNLFARIFENEFALPIHYKVPHGLTLVQFLAMKKKEVVLELGNLEPNRTGKRNTFLQEYVGTDFALLAETIRDGGQEKSFLLEAIQRMIRHAEFRASLTPGQLARDMTETEGGRQFVHLMAKGALAYCTTNGIAIPETENEFEQSLATIARNSGAEGGIALIDPEAFGDLIEWINIESSGTISMRHLADFGRDLFNQTDRLRAAGNIKAARKIDAIRLLGSDTDFLSLQEKAHWLREWIGPQAKSLAEAFKHGDCQRRLVFQEMRKMISRSS